MPDNPLGIVSVNPAALWCLERLCRQGLNNKTVKCYQGLASGYAGFSIKQGPKTLGEEALGKAALDTFLRVSAPGVVLWLRQQAPACVPQGLTIERMQMADGKGKAFGPTTIWRTGFKDLKAFIFKCFVPFYQREVGTNGQLPSGLQVGDLLEKMCLAAWDFTQGDKHAECVKKARAKGKPDPTREEKPMPENWVHPAMLLYLVYGPFGDQKEFDFNPRMRNGPLPPAKTEVTEDSDGGGSDDAKPASERKRSSVLLDSSALVRLNPNCEHMSRGKMRRMKEAAAIADAKNRRFATSMELKRQTQEAVRNNTPHLASMSHSMQRLASTEESKNKESERRGNFADRRQSFLDRIGLLDMLGQEDEAKVLRAEFLKWLTQESTSGGVSEASERGASQSPPSGASEFTTRRSETLEKVGVDTPCTPRSRDRAISDTPATTTLESPHDSDCEVTSITSSPTRNRSPLSNGRTHAPATPSDACSEDFDPSIHTESSTSSASPLALFSTIGHSSTVAPYTTPAFITSGSSSADIGGSCAAAESFILSSANKSSPNSSLDSNATPTAAASATPFLAAGNIGYAPTAASVRSGGDGCRPPITAVPAYSSAPSSSSDGNGGNRPNAFFAPVASPAGSEALRGAHCYQDIAGMAFGVPGQDAYAAAASHGAGGSAQWKALGTRGEAHGAGRSV